MLAATGRCRTNERPARQDAGRAAAVSLPATALALDDAVAAEELDPAPPRGIGQSSAATSSGRYCGSAAAVSLPATTGTISNSMRWDQLATHRCSSVTSSHSMS